MIRAGARWSWYERPTVTPAELGPHITGDENQAVGVLTAAATLALD